MSTVTYVVGRIFISVIFVASGISKFMNVKGAVADILEKKNIPIPVEIEAYVGMPRYLAAGYAVAGVELLFGALLLFGLLTRFSALVLFLFTAATIPIVHDFWTMQGDAYIDGAAHAMKNLAIMGGLLLLMSDATYLSAVPLVEPAE